MPVDTLAPDTNLLQLLGWEETPEKVWVWAFPDGKLQALHVDREVYREVSTSAKGIYAAQKASLDQRFSNGYTGRDGWPELREIQDVGTSHTGFILYDDNGKEIRRWECARG